MKNDESVEAARDLSSDLHRLQIDVASALVRWPHDPGLVAIDRIVNGCDRDDCPVSA